MTDDDLTVFAAPDGVSLRARRIYAELGFALSRIERDALAGWGTRSATRLLSLTSRRIDGLAAIVARVGRASLHEWRGARAASHQRRLSEHIGDRAAVAIDGTISIGRNGLGVVTQVAGALLRDPKATAPGSWKAVECGCAGKAYPECLPMPEFLLRRGPMHENRPVAGRRLLCREQVPVALAAVWAAVTSLHPQTTGYATFHSAASVGVPACSCRAGFEATVVSPPAFGRAAPSLVTVPISTNRCQDHVPDNVRSNAVRTGCINAYR
jgi:hypothetical protein